MLELDANPPGTTSDWIEFLDQLDALEDLRRHAERTLDNLVARGGPRVLDVGCGVGHDVRRLAKRVGPSGLVVGVDADERLLVEAARRVSLANCRFGVADARDLPFADGSFDAARVDRVVHAYPDPRTIIGELVRVVRPGGAVMLTEPDVHTLGMAGVDDAVLDPLRSLHASGPRLDARGLSGLLEDAGVVDVACTPCPCRLGDVETATGLYDLASALHAAQRARLLSPVRAFALMVAAKRAQRAGTFAIAIIGHTVIGTRPAAA